jgi:hypothetical protein
MNVRWATYAEAAPFVERWHYSGKVPKGMNLFLCAENAAGPYAYAVYGWGVNPYQESYLAKLLNREVTRHTCVELKRLVRSEPLDSSMPLTQLLSKAHKMLHRERGFRYIVAFADPAEGHAGGIYKAANFAYAGVTSAEQHTVNAEGGFTHRRVAYRRMQTHGGSLGDNRVAMGLTVVTTPRKHRWLLDLREDLRRTRPDLAVAASRGAPAESLLSWRPPEVATSPLPLSVWSGRQDQD